MKKLQILILIFLLQGCATLEKPITTGMTKYEYCAAKNLGAVNAICNNKYYYYENGFEILKKGNTYAIFKNVSKPTTSNFWKNSFGDGTFVAEVNSWSEAQKLVGKKQNLVSNNNSIDFDIKVKKDQCEAIGFKPETEKFADCVLRLVELDVKQQTQNQITVAQNNGNDALVKQLQRQNNLQSSQALIDFGQQLMNPKRYNSNIYMPQTQRCTMQGFGTFATMRCR